MQGQDWIQLRKVTKLSNENTRLLSQLALRSRTKVKRKRFQQNTGRILAENDIEFKRNHQNYNPEQLSARSSSSGTAAQLRQRAGLYS
jgi:hypothetical protein